MTTVASSSDIRAAACRRGSLRRLPLGLLACRLCVLHARRFDVPSSTKLKLSATDVIDERSGHVPESPGSGIPLRAGACTVNPCTTGCLVMSVVVQNQLVASQISPAGGALPCLALTKYSCLLFRTRVVAEESVAQEGTRRRDSCGLRRLDSSLTGRPVDECKSPI